MNIDVPCFIHPLIPIFPCPFVVMAMFIGGASSFTFDQRQIDVEFCSNYRIEIGAVGIKNLEDLANRKLLSDCQNTSTLIIPNRKLLYN